MNSVLVSWVLTQSVQTKDLVFVASLIRFDLIFGVLTPLSAVFQLYHGDQFLVVEEAGENHRPWASNW
jgi:hypothetical protein